MMIKSGARGCVCGGGGGDTRHHHDLSAHSGKQGQERKQKKYTSLRTHTAGPRCRGPKFTIAKRGMRRSGKSCPKTLGFDGFDVDVVP
jgi:hypothetical protein